MKRIKNEASKSIPDELYNAFFGNVNMDEVNDICDAYNLKIFEYSRSFSDDKNDFIDEITIIDK